MDFRKGLIILSVCVALPAMAEIRTLTDARETSPSNMTVPTTSNSRLSFRACDECDLVTARLTPTTAYTVNGERMEFADFRKALLVMRSRGEGYALISIDTQSKTVTSLQVAD